MILSDKVYNVLKWVVLVLLPALTTLVGVILNVLNVDCTDIILTIMTAVTTFLGTILGISNKNYYEDEEDKEEVEEEEEIDE